MEYSFVQLGDLFDEILLIIFKNLYNLQVFYSLIDVNKRLSKIAHNSIFTSHLTLLRLFSNGSIHPLTNSILDRSCLQILPKIHHHIKWLNIESSSIERILLCTKFSSIH
jgi:hypothetical protein